MEMNFETASYEPNLHDFLRELNVMMQKWTAEGNKDVEPSLVASLKQQVEAGELTPQTGIERLHAIDNGRIER